MKELLILALAAAATCGGCREDPPLAVWSGPLFSVAHPAGWVARSTGDDRVLFDGTHSAGSWTLGRTLTVTRERGQAPAGAGFTSGCGSHVCDATLTLRHGGYQLLLHDRSATDDLGRDEARIERELRALAARIVPTLEARTPPEDRPQATQPAGKCQIVQVSTGSRCALGEVHPLGCTDCDPGEGLFRVTHRVTVEGTEWTFRTAVVKAPVARLEELRRWLGSRSPVACAGLIVNPPCNPQGTHVALDLAWPDWVALQQGW